MSWVATTEVELEATTTITQSTPHKKSTSYGQGEAKSLAASGVLATNVVLNESTASIENSNININGGTGNLNVDLLGGVDELVINGTPGDDSVDSVRSTRGAGCDFFAFFFFLDGFPAGSTTL